MSAFVAASVIAAAQSPPAFEAASVKPNLSLNALPIARLTSAGRFQAPNSTLRDLIRIAYDLEDIQILGAPGWAGSDRFAVEATAGASATGSDARAMLRTLLAERFKLTARTEKRDEQGFVLVTSADKRGRDLRPSGPDCAAIRPPQGIPLPPPPPPPPGGPGAATPLGPDVKLVPKCGSMITAGTLSARGMTIAQLTMYLTRNLRRPVLDRTKLSGLFDIDLLFMPETPGPIPASPDAPSLFTAVQEQLGLKLESQRVPWDVLVIDRVERPTEN